MKRTRVKICGTTNLENALFAVDEGVDALGFIFFPKSPRNIEPETAREIIARLPIFVDRVGVFVNSPLEDLVRIASVGLSCIQLHGGESPEFCRELRTVLPRCRIIKAFRVSDATTAADIAPYNDVVDAFLLDTYKKGAEGGTGEVFNWDIIEKLDLQRPLLLAGGLEPDNIEEAIWAVGPYCLDVNSGVELSPGVKDHSKVATLMTTVRRLSTKWE